MYGLGMAEAELAPVLKQRREVITITTKFGINVSAAGSAAARVQGPVRTVLSKCPSLGDELKVLGRGPRSGWVGRITYASAGYTARSAERSLDHSLRTLGTEYIDIFTLHDPVGGLMRGAPDLVAYLNRQRDIGRIRSWGLTGEISELPGVVRELSEQPPLVQFRDDIFDPPPHAGPTLAEASITFGALGRALPALRWFLARFPEERNAWSDRLDVDLRDEASLPTLLVRQAFRRNLGGVVLFTSTRAARMRAAVEAGDEDVGISTADDGAAVSELAAAARSASPACGPAL
jgi:hypothetical protein